MITPNDFRALKRLPFCYLCGGPFNDLNQKSDDHVPPKTIFAHQDREVLPLMLPAHRACNVAESNSDERIGQLLAPLTSRPLGRAHQKLTFYPMQDETFPPSVGAVTGANLSDSIWRWVRGFHAALYKSHLPRHTGVTITTPIAELDLSNPTHLPAEAPLHHAATVRHLAKHVRKGEIDRIACYRNKCRYISLCSHFDDGTPVCIFSLRIYDWKRLGRTSLTRARACIGLYLLPNGHVPASASVDVCSRN